jgi:hypothetical protein
MDERWQKGRHLQRGQLQAPGKAAPGLPATRRTGELPLLKQKLTAVGDRVNRLVAKVAEAAISDEDAKGSLAELRRDREHCQARIQEVTGGPLAEFRITPATTRMLRDKVMDIARNARPTQEAGVLPALHRQNGSGRDPLPRPLQPAEPHGPSGPRFIPGR